MSQRGRAWPALAAAVAALTLASVACRDQQDVEPVGEDPGATSSVTGPDAIPRTGREGSPRGGGGGGIGGGGQPGDGAGGDTPSSQP